MRVDWIEITFQSRLVQPSELDGNIIKPARREAAVEVPQSRDGHANNRNFDVGARVIENEEIKARSLGNVDASQHLLARVETAELRAEARLEGRIAVRDRKSTRLNSSHLGISYAV